MIVPALKKKQGWLYQALHLSFASQLREETADSLDKARFSETLGTAIDVFGVSTDDLCVAFHVTAATISRWRNGAAFPGDFVRTKVVAWLADQIEMMVPNHSPQSPAAKIVKYIDKMND
jgi:hypothetical protein